MDSYPKLNDPKEDKVVPNVSKTNETPISSMGLGDDPMQEMVEVAEERRTLQAPNRKGIWSRSQMPREMAMAGPRFEQVIMEHQVS
jgi:NADH dehydrogenase (ubiquinone) Fe-S protein 6